MRSSLLSLVFPALGLLGVALVGCAYPHRSTALGAVGHPVDAQAPADLWQLRIVSASMPTRRPGNLAWDNDGSGPDPYVRIYRGGERIFEGKVVRDSNAPTWNETLPKNVWLPRDKELRIEVWDQDDLESDPVGMWTNLGLPATALVDADARLGLTNETSLVIRVERPLPHRGVGVAGYEARNDALIVGEVLPHSPASRAGIVVGDRIVDIGGKSVEELGPAGAASALSMAATEKKALVVESADGKRREVTLDNGYIWLSM